MSLGIDKKTLITELSGVDRDGKPKCSLVFLNEIWNNVDQTQETFTELPIDTPAVYIFMTDKKTYLTLEFDSDSNKELIMLWDSLKKFYVAENSFEESGEMVPMTIFTLYPNNEDEELEAYISLVNPESYELFPERPGEEFNTLRFVFDNDDFWFFKNVDYKGKFVQE